MPSTFPRATHDGNEHVVRRHRKDRTHHVYLVPGFLGFVNLGRITYFGHVRRALGERFAALGFDARIHLVRTPPTASLPTRAARLAEAIAATARRDAAAASDRPLERRPRRAPAHRPGRRAADRRRRGAAGGSRSHGRHGVDAASRHPARVVLHDAAGPAAAAGPLAEHHLRAALRSPAHLRAAVDGGHGRCASAISSRTASCSTSSSVACSRTSRWGDAAQCGRCCATSSDDQSLMLQLTPEAMEVFNASVLPRPGVRYGAVVTQAARPSLRATLAVGSRSGGAGHARASTAPSTSSTRRRRSLRARDSPRPDPRAETRLRRDPRPQTRATASCRRSPRSGDT